MTERRFGRTDAPAPTRSSALDGLVSEGDAVLLVGLEVVSDATWEVLLAAGLRVLRAGDPRAAIRIVEEGAAQVVFVDAQYGPDLIRAVRARPELAGVHVVACVDLDSPHELRDALDAGADDIMRVAFEPDVLILRVATGLRAARLRANDAMLRSLIDSIPGAIYRCACDRDWTMEWLSDEIETMTGYPASDFIGSAVRTFASIEHPDDHDYVADRVMESVRTGRPFSLEYRLVRRDGSICWVLERGLAQEAGDGRWWLDGAIFDITQRREAEHAMREHAVTEAQLSEVRASRARILEAADRARRDIERNLHDGAQQRLVSVALSLRIWLTTHKDLPDDCRAPVLQALDELGNGLGELRALARGLHPAVLSDHGLEHALRALAQRVHRAGRARHRAAGRAAPDGGRGGGLLRRLRGAHQRRPLRGGESGLGRRRGARRRARGDDPRRRLRRRELGAGSGLQGLRDRVSAMNGTLEIDSPPGAGTTVCARLPSR